MLLVLCLLSFLLCLKFSGCGFLSSVCPFCLVAFLLKIRSMLVYFLFYIQTMVLFFCLCLVCFFFAWLIEVWLNLSGCGLVSSVLSGAFGLK